MTPVNPESYFHRYCAAARRFEVIGGILLLIGILLNLFVKSLSTVSIIVAAFGALLLIIGGSSLRPHNLVKAFAQQCAREPGHEIAQGLLDAMHTDKKIRLMQKSINELQIAIGVYESLEDADADLVAQLHEAADTRIAKKAF